MSVKQFLLMVLCCTVLVLLLLELREIVTPAKAQAQDIGTVVCRELKLVDAAGQPRIRMGLVRYSNPVITDQAAIQLFDQKNQLRGEIRMEADGGFTVLTRTPPVSIAPVAPPTPAPVNAP